MLRLLLLVPVVMEILMVTIAVHPFEKRSRFSITSEPLCHEVESFDWLRMGDVSNNDDVIMTSCINHPKHVLVACRCLLTRRDIILARYFLCVQLVQNPKINNQPCVQVLYSSN